MPTIVGILTFWARTNGFSAVLGKKLKCILILMRLTYFMLIGIEREDSFITLGHKMLQSQTKAKHDT